VHHNYTVLIYALIYGYDSSSDYTVSNDGAEINNELEESGKMLIFFSENCPKPQPAQPLPGPRFESATPWICSVSFNHSTVPVAKTSYKRLYGSGQWLLYGSTKQRTETELL
jgi:hypothetical protein